MDRLDEILPALQKHGSKTAAAKALGMTDGAFRRRFDHIQSKKTGGVSDVDVMRDRIRSLESRLIAVKRETLDDHYVRNSIIGLVSAKPKIPGWMIQPSLGDKLPGVPTLFASDWHWGEVVDGAQIGNVNSYDIGIAQARAQALIERTITLLRDHVVCPDYPGIVFALGGDMLSGDIHDELVRTNALESMPTLLDLLGVMIWAIKTLADEFGKVFIPAVTGNHGRLTRKPMAKNRVFTNYDWLLYSLLEKHFENDERIRFMVPSGPDALYAVYGHRYLLTHGDQFRGGDGQIGAIGPITRGNKRKLARNTAIGADYDTMILGHWHQYMPLHRSIVNGCFPSGSKVMTSNGYNAIEQVTIGDSVMSRDGTKQEVTHVFTKEADRLIGIKVHGLPDVVQSTPNHLVWAVKRASAHSDVTPSRRHMIDAKHGPAQWIPMDFLSPGDYVHVPFPKGNERPVDVETAWAYGLFLAEGSVLLDGGAKNNHNRIQLTMHERELGVLQRFAEWFKKTYGGEPRVFVRTKRAGGKTSEFSVSPGRDVCLSFRDMFGHLASGKHLPAGALLWADDLKAALLQGWIDGDGHKAKQKDCRPTVSATTISQELAWGMFRISPAAGMWPSLAKLAKGGPRKNDSYTVHQNVGQHLVEINGEVFYQIAERFETTGKFQVFDLEVSGEHTYCVGGVGVHNSLKGYDEYANSCNFEYEPPTQALWLTHPQHGITISMPVYCDEHRNKDRSVEWLQWAA